MDVPRLSVTASEIDEIVSNASAAVGVAGRMIEMLRAHPHFLVLEGPPPSEDRRLTVALAKAIANADLGTAGERSARQEKVSFTRVQIDPQKLGIEGPATHYSRTNQRLELHTDVSYSKVPPELVAFQMVRADPVGGDTLMLAVEDIVANLADDVRARLEQPSFPFGRGNYPVLWEQNGAICIRYYRTNIEEARSKGDDAAADDVAALDALDEVLLREDLSFRFHVEPGETVFLHNTRALHGRTGFPPDSSRLMYRIRVHARCLI